MPRIFHWRYGTPRRVDKTKINHGHNYFFMEPFFIINFLMKALVSTKHPFHSDTLHQELQRQSEFTEVHQTVLSSHCLISSHGVSKSGANNLNLLEPVFYTTSCTQESAGDLHVGKQPHNDNWNVETKWPWTTRPSWRVQEAIMKMMITLRKSLMNK